GASGLVGRALVRRLLADEAGPAVVAVVRRPLGISSGRLTEVVADFSRLEGVAVPHVRTAFCALGTTIAKAGSEAAFRAVDVEAVVGFAQLARRAGASRFLLVSALGADAQSKVFYNRTKGEAEEAVQAVGFDGVALFRPSLLVGERAESRPAERMAIVASGLFSWAMAGPLVRWKPVPAEAVAAAMVAVASGTLTGVRIVENDEIHRLAP
ncbi:MAG TPA: NAD(P)H-binding protein, partial [Thermoanaerobaculia bacterium]|nr:NAD(P)H-binding protein [Thermoanaerobaculia bacterium]